MRALLHRCRRVVAGLILGATLAATGALAGNAPEPERAARQPLIEVVAFGVAPVAGIEEDRELEPRPGDILHRRERVAAHNPTETSKASLFTATDAVGLPEAIVLQLAEIFAGDVDFHRELHHGYRCSLVYEVLYRDGHIERPGRILAAEFVIRNRRLNAYFFDGGKGRAGYFTETGRGMRKIFRRSPVEFSRVTSEYTLARFHPVLATWRAHRGTDYAAPSGAAVLATADGVVDFAGERGELGNLVILRHHDRFLTYYGHLSAFAEGIAAGSEFKQGQVIGFVGMTGLATGPHLHYEFHVVDANGQGISVPPLEVLEAPPADSREFFEAMKNYRGQLELAARAHVVTLD